MLILKLICPYLIVLIDKVDPIKQLSGKCAIVRLKNMLKICLDTCKAEPYHAYKRNAYKILTLINPLPKKSMLKKL